MLDLGDLFEPVTVFDWSLADRDEAARWSGSTPFVVAGDGLHVRLREQRSVLERQVEIDADEVRYVDVVVSGPRDGGLRLMWARDGEELTPQRSLTLQSGQGVGKKTRRYRFTLGSYPWWRGTVTRLRLVLRDQQGDEIVLGRVSGSRLTASHGAVVAATGRPLKLELGHDLRNGFVAPADHVVARRVTVCPDSRLRLAFGVHNHLRHELEFRVVVASEHGERVVMQRHLGPEQGGAWHEQWVALGEPVRREVELRLETSSAEAHDPADGLPLWANPEVVRPGVPGEGLNVLLVVVDTLRADHLSLYGYPKETTPHLEQWARRSAVVFRRVVASAPWTFPSHVSLFSGLDAVHHGFNHDVGGVENENGRQPIARLELLAEILQRRGYATRAVTGGAYLHPRYGLAQGFDGYAWWADRSRDDNELESGVSRALEWMSAHQQGRFFFFLHTYAVHDPYTPRQPFFARLAPQGIQAPEGEVAITTPPNSVDLGFQQHNRLVVRGPGPVGDERPVTQDDLPMVRAVYDSGVAYMDEQMGRLLAGLRELGLDRRTVVVFTADHGEALGERGQLGHVTLYDHTLLVPLVIAFPDGLGAGRVVHTQVRLVDLLPTLLEALDMDQVRGVDGVSLMGLVDGTSTSHPSSAWSYSTAGNYGVCVREGNRLKYVYNTTVWAPVRGDEELYDLVEDPAETVDLAARDERVAGLRQQMRTYLDETAVGLRVRFFNSGPGILRGVLRGHPVRPVGTESPDMECACLRWAGMGQAELEVPAGKSFTVFLEKVLGEELIVKGALDAETGSSGFARTFELAELSGVSGVRFDGAEWLVHGSGAGPGTGIEVWWHGATTLHTDSPSVLDDGLCSQLEALGYVD